MEIKIAGKKYISTSEAAKRLDVNSSRVRQLVRAGFLRSQKLHERLTVVLEDDVIARAAEMKGKYGHEIDHLTNLPT